MTNEELKQLDEELDWAYQEFERLGRMLDNPNYDWSEYDER